MSGVIPYLTPKAVNSALPSRHFLTGSGILSENCLTKSLRLIKSLIEPLAALSKRVPIKATVFLAVASSKHGTTVLVSGNLFCSKSPLNTCWRISLSAN